MRACMRAHVWGCGYWAKASEVLELLSSQPVLAVSCNTCTVTYMRHMKVPFAERIYLQAPFAVKRRRAVFRAPQHPFNGWAPIRRQQREGHGGLQRSLPLLQREQGLRVQLPGRGGITSYHVTLQFTMHPVKIHYINHTICQHPLHHKLHQLACYYLKAYLCDILWHMQATALDNSARAVGDVVPGAAPLWWHWWLEPTE